MSRRGHNTAVTSAIACDGMPWYSRLRLLGLVIIQHLLLFLALLVLPLLRRHCSLASHTTSTGGRTDRIRPKSNGGPPPAPPCHTLLLLSPGRPHPPVLLQPAVTPPPDHGRHPGRQLPLHHRRDQVLVHLHLQHAAKGHDTPALRQPAALYGDALLEVPPTHPPRRPRRRSRPYRRTRR